MKSNLMKQVAATFLLTAGAAAANAEYTNVYVFGDSLSDIGNLTAFTQDPNIPERFTNGPVAVELVAGQLGYSLTPSYHLLPPEATGGVYGNNFATAGAVAIDEDGDLTTPDINLPTQVGAYLQLNGFQASEDALHIVMIGGNDIFAAQDEMINGSWGSYFDAYDRVAEAAQAVEEQLSTLVATGAKNIVVVNAPNVGATENTDIKAQNLLDNADSFHDYVVAWGLPALTKTLSEIYNLELELAVMNVENATGVDIKEFDLYSSFDYIIKNYEALGYTNKDNACVYALTGGGFNPECNFDTFVFFDEIHPTAVTHERAAADFMEAIQ